METPSSSSPRCCCACCTECIGRYRLIHGYEHTSIPLREQFRCRRFLFFYHDFRAFTTSVLPQPIFVVYRIALVIYLLLWILYDGIEEQEGAGYLVFFTIWGYILLIIGLVAMTIASFVHTIVSCINPKLIESRIPQYSELEPKESYFQQDHTPWYLKIAWMLYVFGVVPSLPIVFVYWVFVGNNATVTAENVHLHGLNFFFALLDILISRVPIQLLHFYLIMLFGVMYTVFQAVFFAAGGTNPNDGGNYVYRFIDFGSSPGSAAGFCLLLIFVGAVIHVMFFGIAQARDQIAKCIPRCYWNVKSVHRDSDDLPIDMLREAWLISPPSMNGRDNKDNTTAHHTYIPDKMANDSNGSDDSIRSSPSETQV